MLKEMIQYHRIKYFHPIDSCQVFIEDKILIDRKSQNNCSNRLCVEIHRVRSGIEWMGSSTLTI